MRMKTSYATLAILGALSTTLTLSAPATDWPQWRGPSRSGLAADDKHTLTALPKQMDVLWTEAVGNGQSAPVIEGNRLIHLDEQNGKEVAHALDLGTGKEIWKVPYADAVDFSNTYGPGPRCTPLIDEDRVYVQSCNGEFQCLSLKDGKTIWHANFGKDFGAIFFGQSQNPDANQTAARRHGNNGSSVIDGDRIFVPVGSPQGACLVCFDKKTGKVLWKAGDDNAAYSALMVATIAGTRQVVDFTADSLMGVDCARGRILWRVPVKTGAKRNIVTPIINGDSVTIASHTVGLIKFKITKTGDNFKAEEAWRNSSMKINIATPVLVKGYLYGLGAGAKTSFVCVNFENGQEMWSQPGFGDYASVVALQDKLLVLNSTGEMFLLAADSTKYNELGRLQVCGKTWSFPAYVDGRLYVRDGKQLFALELVK